MSYPPPLYDGDSGEISATIRPGSAEPDLVYPNGNRVAYLATGGTTGDLFGLYKWEFSEAVSGPGAPREAYFEGLAAGMGNLDADDDDRFMREHDNTWV